MNSKLLELVRKTQRFGTEVMAFGVSINLSYSTMSPVSTGMSDHLRVGIPPRYVTNHPGELSLLSPAGREMNNGQSAVTLCGWKVKAGWFMDKRVGGM